MACPGMVPDGSRDLNDHVLICFACLIHFNTKPDQRIREISFSHHVNVEMS
jgi:hypothetical protein